MLCAGTVLGGNSSWNSGYIEYSTSCYLFTTDICECSYASILSTEVGENSKENYYLCNLPTAMAIDLFTPTIIFWALSDITLLL